MKVFRNIENLNLISPVVSIGIFDGVHKAHQEILKKICTVAKNKGGESALITLWPHPRHVIASDNKLKLISTLDEKIKHLENSGIDNLIILPFNQKLAETPFDKFVTDILIAKLKIKHLIVGYNHHFGKNREGNYEKLIDFSKNYNFGLEKLSQYVVDGFKVSSSQIRQLINNGEISKANSLLGYKFSISGCVVKGEQIGRRIGFPTANIEIEEPLKIIPKKGVYAIEAEVESKNYKGMLNIGTRPTINTDNEFVIEAHLFNFNENIYNKRLTIFFNDRIRDEKKFSNLDELKEQLINDAISVKNVK